MTDVLLGGDVESAAGDVDLVLGTFTAVESAADVAFDAKDTCEPVRKRAAARRGREAEDEELLFALRLMRAASWFSDGMRAPVVGRSGLGTSTTGASVDVEDVDIIELVVELDEFTASCWRHRASDPA